MLLCPNLKSNIITKNLKYYFCSRLLKFQHGDHIKRLDLSAFIENHGDFCIYSSVIENVS